MKQVPTIPRLDLTLQELSLMTHLATIKGVDVRHAAFKRIIEERDGGRLAFSDTACKVADALVLDSNPCQPDEEHYDYAIWLLRQCGRAEDIDKVEQARRDSKTHAEVAETIRPAAPRDK